MNPREIKELVLEEIQEYFESNKSNDSDMGVGTPWENKKITKEIEIMKSCLVEPFLCEFKDYLTALTETPIAKTCWVVADDEGFSRMFYDPTTSEFVLSQKNTSGEWVTWGVRGDPVGVFLAR